MRSSTLQRVIVVCALLLSSAHELLRAQTTYQGFLEDIYPTRLVIEESTPVAVLSVSTLSNQVKFIGGCNDGKCKYRAIDTAMTLVFERTDERIQGRIQLGDGTSKILQATQLDADIPFASACESEFFLRTWVDEDLKHQLVLTTLPGKQVKGTFYLTELGTRFSVSGTATATQLNLLLEGSTSKYVGSLSIQLEDQTDTGKQHANLTLEGSKTTIAFQLVEEMPLNCLQAEGKYDMIYPTLEGTSYVSVPLQLWKEIGKRREGYSHAWFEPTLFNKHVLSGWMHAESSATVTSEPINLIRDDKNNLRQAKLLGGKRTKLQLIADHKARAIDQHPLRGDSEFRAWAEALDFSKFTLTVEGLSLASERHPIYGQLESTVPWRELPKTENLPKWLTQVTP